jgi:transcription-repair coupling factor (superfamily II helicase)
MRLSERVDHAIETAIANCTTVADIAALSRELVDRYPQLRPHRDELLEVLVARATAKGLAVRFEGEEP